MGRELLRDVRKEIALEVLAEWVYDLLRSYPGDITLPCGHCLRQSVLDLPRPGETAAHHRRRLKQRQYQRAYRERMIAKKEGV